MPNSSILGNVPSSNNNSRNQSRGTQQTLTQQNINSSGQVDIFNQSMPASKLKTSNSNSLVNQNNKSTP